ncbi:RRXRR domain-containing protein [uncultured Thiocystis sp.]|jgi:hypothetical protein|uniref:RRXRR domain-containing protein n=1 Tax=uncultured Thiocystis sp. TaxID=1202134 RepID=UPI0025D4E35F|nr:RRXRR domain-containing protein [uncultured Thiocystis sp.]
MPTSPTDRPPRHFLAVPTTLFQDLQTLSPENRARLFQHALDVTRGRVRVLVCDADRVLLNPCRPARARQLLAQRRAHFLCRTPPLLQLRTTVANPEQAQ